MATIAENPTFLSSLINELRDSYRYRYVCYSYVQTNLRLRYRRSFLGFFWTLITPLASYAIMGFIFSYSMKVQVPNFIVYFFTGAVFFNFLSVGLGRAPLAMLENENYMRKLYVPKLNFVLNGIFLETVNFILGMLALLILGLAFQKLSLNWSMLYLPVPIFITFITLVGSTALLSVMTVFYRDIKHVVPLLMQSIFFLTPVFYTINQIPERYRWIVKLNPLYHLVESFRIPVVDGVLPPIEHFVYSAFFALISLAIGIYTLRKYDNKVVFKL